jgi:hypothetical protein
MLSLNNGTVKPTQVLTFPYKFDLPTRLCRKVLPYAPFTNNRIEECHGPSSKLASQRIQLFDPRPSSKPFNSTLLRRTIRTRIIGLSRCPTLRQWRSMAARRLQWLCSRIWSRASSRTNLRRDIYGMADFH